jgi:NIMA (never in mitosis gene a)-related kinase
MKIKEARKKKNASLSKQ